MRFTDSTPASIREAGHTDLPPGRLTPRRMIAQGTMPYPVLHKSETMQEPEDAKLTGATRSLGRRLLALNLRGSVIKPALGNA